MEHELRSLLDTMDEEQAALLLESMGRVPLGRAKTRRLQGRLLQRLRGEKQRQMLRFQRVLAVAAALVIVAGSVTVSVFGLDEIAYQAAKVIDRFYQFVPDYGFVEGGETIRFALKEQVTAENSEVMLRLSSAYVTDNSLQVVLTLTRKNMTHEDFLREKENNAYHSEMTKLLLSVSGVAQEAGSAWKSYEDFTGSSAYNGLEEQAVYHFALDGAVLREDTQYRLTCKDYDLNLVFQLQPIEALESPDEIGSTDSHNQISVTAVPSFAGDRLEISLFPLNNSDYTLDSFTKHIGIGSPGGQDLYLETDSGIKAYETPGGYMGPNTKFAFSVEESDRSFTLHIPFLVVKSQEHRNIRLRLPKRGETLLLNTPLEFKDCTMTIVEAQRRKAEMIGDFDELKLTLRYENKRENQIMSDIGVTRLKASGQMKSGTAWSSLPDENGVTTEMYIALERGDLGSLYLQFYDPLYYLTDAYTLAFGR